METNVKAVKSLRNTTITISTIAIIVAIVLTIGVILVFSGGAQPVEGYMSVMPLAEKTDQLSDRGLLAIGAGLSCIGMLGAGIGQGYAGGKAAEAVGRNPEAEGKIRNMMIVGAAIAESSALYALVIAIMCLFVA